MCCGKDGGDISLRGFLSNSVRVTQSWCGHPKAPRPVPIGTREGSGGQNSHLVSPYWTEDPSEGCINAAMDASQHSSYRLLEEVPLLQGQRVGLGDDGDDVDHLTEAPHELHIQRPETGGRRRL